MKTLFTFAILLTCTSCIRLNQSTVVEKGEVTYSIDQHYIHRFGPAGYCKVRIESKEGYYILNSIANKKQVYEKH